MSKRKPLYFKGPGEVWHEECGFYVWSGGMIAQDDWRNIVAGTMEAVGYCGFSEPMIRLDSDDKPICAERTRTRPGNLCKKCVAAKAKREADRG